MVDTSEAMESNFISVDVVKNSPTKKCVVTDPGSYETDEFKNRKLTIGVNIDGKTKKWRPNKPTVENLQVYGNDSTNWVGKIVDLTIEKPQGKAMEMVIGRPAAVTPTTEQV